MNIDTSRAMQSAKDAFTDVNSLDGVKAMGRRKDPEALRKIAQQFESMFMQQMLKNMRSTNEVFSEGNDLNSNESQFHQQMFDHQMALEMSKGKGMGLADVLFRQMSAQFGDEFKSGDLDTHASKKSLQDYFDRSASVMTPVQSRKIDDDKSISTVDNTAEVKPSAKLTPQEFIDNLLSQAQSAAAKINVKPEVLLAQSALETGWGQHVIHDAKGSNSHNLFNIKADQRWDGDSIKVSTLEYRDGIAAKEQASFRQYDSYADSFEDYVDFLQSNPRYENALKHASDPEAYTAELQRAGYATDPKYAEKINRLIQGDVIQGAVKKQLSMADNGLEGGS